MEVYKNNQIERFVNALTDLALNSQDPGLLREGIENIVRCFLANEPAAPSVKGSFDREAVRNAAIDEAAEVCARWIRGDKDLLLLSLPKLIELLKTQSSGNTGQLAGEC